MRHVVTIEIVPGKAAKFASAFGLTYDLDRRRTVVASDVVGVVDRRAKSSTPGLRVLPRC